MGLEYKGAIFDVDGVLLTTAKFHADAWKEMFDSFLKNYSLNNNRPFLPFDKKKDYSKYVDGRPRYEGVKSFLESRKIRLLYGSPKDSGNKKSICGLGNRKNEIFIKMLEKQKPFVYDSSIDLIKSLQKSGIKVAAVSSSKKVLP